MNFKPVDTATSQFWTSSTSAQVHTSLLEYFKNTGGKIQTQTVDGFTVKYGSKLKARLLGMAMGGEEIYPRLLTVKWITENNGTHVNISVSDEFGFGSRIGIENRVRLLLEKHGTFIRSRFPDAV